MKLLIISDIHAYSRTGGDGSKPSYVSTEDDSEASPTNSFMRLIKAKTIEKPDLIICPGDLGDKADPTSINFAWGFLKSVMSLSKKKILISSTGNHDLNSRYIGGDFDAKGTLMDLLPIYPVVTKAGDATRSDTDLHLSYWTRNFCILNVDKVRFLILNTSAFHGHGEKEHEHGRISESTLRNIKKHLTVDNEHLIGKAGILPELNILVCHHHLVKDGAINDPDYSQIVGAHALVEFLSDTDNGRWMVIHGHRHRARLFSIGGSTGPIVLSSASFAATRDRDYDNTSPCQCHLVNLDFEAMKEHSLYPAGSVQSLTWVPPRGWEIAHAQQGGLPPLTGFGYRDSIDRLAKTVAELVGSEASVPWATLLTQNPLLKFVDFNNITELKKTLRTRYKVETFLDENKQPYQCGVLNG